MEYRMGHNRAGFDNIVEENLLRGLYLVQLEALTRCVSDTEMSRRHHQVLCQIILHTNNKTGMAYPGRAHLAAEIVYYANGGAKHYSEATIATTIAELVEAGYLISTKRAAEGKGRALAHYVVTKPSLEELQARITDWCIRLRGQPKREHPASRLKADVDTRIINDPRIHETEAEATEAHVAENPASFKPSSSSGATRCSRCNAWRERLSYRVSVTWRTASSRVARSLSLPAGT